MKKILMVQNPVSGQQSFRAKVDRLSLGFLNNNICLQKYITQKKGDAEAYLRLICKEDWDAIVVCGGDGTLHEVVNGMAAGGGRIPIAVYSAGTVNDLSNYLGMPSDPEAFIKIVLKNNIRALDLGKWGKKYFINVISGGIFSSVAHETPIQLKNYLGRMAYIMKALESLPQKIFQSFEVEVQNEKETFREDIIFFLIANSTSVGGFSKIMPLARADDGLLDCLLIRNADITTLSSLFVQLIKGKHLNHPAVRYFQSKQIELRFSQKIILDIDGEYAGDRMEKIEVEKRRIDFIVP